MTPAHVVARDLAKGICADFAQMVQQSPERPEPKETLRNIERHRAFSFHTFCVGLAGVALSSDVSREQLAFFCRALFVRLLQIAPIAPLCPRTAYLQESSIEGAANVAQIHGYEAMTQTGNIADVERSLDLSVQHRFALDCLIDQHVVKLTELRTTRSNRAQLQRMTPMQLQRVVS